MRETKLIENTERAFVEIIPSELYGIYDTELNTFVKTRVSGKYFWEEKRHASCAFNHALSTIQYGYEFKTSMKDYPRYEVRKFNE